MKSNNYNAHQNIQMYDAVRLRWRQDNVEHSLPPNRTQIGNRPNEIETNAVVFDAFIFCGS